MYKHKLSIVLCTYNRFDALKDCLESLSKQTCSRENHEVIIIDNNSSDDTSILVNGLLKKNSNWRYLLEKKQGLSVCRNLGVKESKNDLIAFIDDDAIADPNWAENILKFNEKNPKVLVYGGYYEPYFRKNPPGWLPNDYGYSNLGEDGRSIRVGKEWLTGLNIVFCKEVFRRYGLFDEGLGMKGKKVGYGEETALQKKVFDDGNDVYYVPGISVKHLVPEYKFSLRWNLKSFYMAGKVKNKVENISDDLLQNVISFVKSVIYSIFLMLKPPYDVPVKRRIYYSFRHLFFTFGSLF